MKWQPLLKKTNIAATQSRRSKAACGHLTPKSFNLFIQPTVQPGSSKTIVELSWSTSKSKTSLASRPLRVKAWGCSTLKDINSSKEVNPIVQTAMI